MRSIGIERMGFAVVAHDMQFKMYPHVCSLKKSSKRELTNDGGDSNGTSPNTISKVTKYNKMRTESWNKMFQRFVVYKQQNGNANIPRIYKKDQKLMDDYTTNEI